MQWRDHNDDLNETQLFCLTIATTTTYYYSHVFFVVVPRHGMGS